MKPPRYIQVIRLLAPGKTISFREAANLGSRHFDWYKNCDKPVKEMEKMLRSSLKRYPDLVTEIEEKQFIDTSKALIFAQNKYPISYYDESDAVNKPKENLPTTYVIPIFTMITITLFTLFQLLVVDSNAGPTVSKILQYERDGNLSALLAMQEDANPILLYTEAELKNYQDSLRDEWGFEIIVPNVEWKESPYSDLIARSISKTLATPPVHLDHTNLIAVLPNLDTPVWIFYDGTSTNAVHIGTNVFVSSRNRGYVSEVRYTELKYVRPDGSIATYKRPHARVIFSEQNTFGSLFLGRGNLKPLYEYFVGEYNGRGGAILGWHPSFHSVEEVSTFLKNVASKDIALSICYNNMSVSKSFQPDELLITLTDWLPFETKISAIDNPVIRYRGQNFDKVLEYLNANYYWVDGQLFLEVP
ncbi:MAG: hypothetical protein QNK37_08485 [Acidobacteriota bacterium]|nr:hypothetical protein [Acidobacteriota bacterium]